MSFSELGLAPAILRALEEAGYTEATPVQQQAIPAALKGGDLIVSAQTGSGKTAAFLLPAMHRLTTPSTSSSRGPRVLVLTPTRELARQVTDASSKYSKHIPRLRTVSILGGTPYMQQQRMLSRPVDILVATPGRFIDLMQQGRIATDRVEMLILDEADRMLDMGFIDDVETIASRLPAERQTLLFSATVEGDLARLASEILKNPEHITIDTVRSRNENITQRIYFSDDVDHKKALLTSVLGQPEVEQAIVFTSTKIDADNLAVELGGWGIASAALHGDMRQSMRNRTLKDMHDKKVKVLVATDVAARGIDVAGITHVINFDLPKGAEDYVHRIGRTGRAGRSGTAISLVSRRDRGMLARITNYTGQHIEADVIAGLEPKERPRSNFGDRPRPAGGQRRGNDEGRRFNREDRAPRSFDRAPRDGAREERTGGWQERRPRPEGGEGRSYQDRPRHESEGRSFGDRPRFDRAPRRFDGEQNENFGNRPPRDDNFGNRAPREGEARPYQDRPRFAGAGREDRPWQNRGAEGAGRPARSFDRAPRPAGAGFAGREDRPWQNRGAEGAGRPARSFDRAPRPEGAGFAGREDRPWQNRGAEGAGRPARSFDRAPRPEGNGGFQGRGDQGGQRRERSSEWINDGRPNNRPPRGPRPF